jgi:hypothetical protein
LFGRVASGRICRSCFDLDHAKLCDGCGQARAVNNRDDDGRALCNTCQNRRRDRRRKAAQRYEIIRLVLTAFPSADATVVESALIETVGANGSVTRLFEHLAACPEVLLSGPTSTVAVLDRFVVALGRAGVLIETIHPLCDRCGRRRRWHARTQSGGECSTCRPRNPKDPCGSCGRPRRVDHRDGTNRPICRDCWEIAGRQSRLDQLANEITTALQARYPQTSQQALQTAITASAPTVRDRARLGRLLADAPDLHTVFHRPVPLAHFLVAARAEGVNFAAAACEDCHGPAEPPVVYRRIVRCPACARRCPGCARSTKDPDQPLCPECQVDPRGGDCVECGTPTLRDHTGRCARCRQHQDHRCARCDSTARRTWMEGSWLCPRCALKAIFDTEIAPPETLPNVLAPLRDAVVVADNWRVVSRWLTKSIGGQLLGRLARRELPITHETLDQAARGGTGGAKSVEHLRALLVSTGALPEVATQPVDAFERFAARRVQTATIDAGDAKATTAWLRWQVLPALRAQAEAKLPLNRTRGDLAAILGLLETVAARGRNLRGMTQTDLDRWFARPGYQAWRVRPFLVWARARGHLRPELTVPARPGRSLRSPLDHQARWDIARRLVVDDSIPADRRVAAALLVLDGQTLARITQLTTTDIYRGADGAVVVVLGGNPMPIHQPFANLIAELPLPRTNGISDHAHDRHWLFPGRRAGQPISTGSMAGWLRALGIEPRNTRNTARAQLAGTIPAAMLAEILGIGAQTATRWTAIANGNWAAYVAARTASP